MKRILLTGGTGFLGNNIRRDLLKNEGMEEYVLAFIGSKSYDLRNPIDCKRVIDHYKPYAIIHAAGNVGGIGANKDNPGKFMYDNLIMGTNIIEESRAANVSKFIMLGTVCAYPKFAEIPFKEKDMWNGYPEETNAPYGIAKKALMKLVETYHEQYNMNGVNLVPVNMYGKYDHFNLTTSHVIPALILKVHRAMTQNEPMKIWGTGEASREFLYASDCVKAISLAIQKDVGPEPINIGTGKEIKIKDLVEKITNLMGYNGTITYDRSKPDGQPRRCLDTNRAKERLGFTAETSLDEGLERTINWFL